MNPEIKNQTETTPAGRDRVIFQTSMIGIGVNVLLAALKATVGLLSHSIAVLLDAVNNLSDALSSVITIFGVRLASRRPDKKHPLGHGRIEYLSAMLVSAIVLYAGITALIESVKKILHPEQADYSILSLLIIAAAVVAKLLLGRYVKQKGKEVNSSSLTASGADALFDAILSLSVLLSAIVFLITGLSLGAYVGVVIAAFIIKAGIEMMQETLDDILGVRPDAELTSKIKHILNEEPEVYGAYDLFLNNYGPDKNYASVHLELDDTMTVQEVDTLTRRLQSKVYNETGVVLTGVGVYSHNTTDNEAAQIRNTVQKIVLSHDWALQFHGFYAEPAEKLIRFDVVMSFEIDPKQGIDILTREVLEQYPDYTVVIAPDVDISD